MIVPIVTPRTGRPGLGECFAQAHADRGLPAGHTCGKSGEVEASLSQQQASRVGRNTRYKTRVKLGSLHLPKAA